LPELIASDPVRRAKLTITAIVVTASLLIVGVWAAAFEHALMAGAIAAAVTLILAGLAAFLILEIRRSTAKETALVDEHAKLDRIQQIAGIGSIEVDIVTGLVKWSPGACMIFGVDSNAVEPTVEYVLGFVHGDDRTTVAEAAAESRALGVAAPPLEYRIIRPDGAVRIVYREYDMQYDPEGRPIRRIMTFKDITQIKATEIRLRQSMEDLDRVQRIAGIGSTTEELATGEYTWSPGACAIFGVDQDAVEPTVEYMRRFYHPSDRAPGSRRQRSKPA
jgi:PAS domain S-box-containing protein